MSALMQHRLLAIDEGRQQLSLVDTGRNDFAWTLDLADFPLARDLQRIGRDTALVGYERGFFELDIASGKVLRVCSRYQGVTAARRLDDGATLLTGVGLGGAAGVGVLRLDEALAPCGAASREGAYVRLMRTTAGGGYLLCANDHIIETDAGLATLGVLRTPGLEHAWMAERQADGSTLVSAGYGGFMARFGADHRCTATFGGCGQVPAEVAPYFYASFQQVGDGRLLVANWQGHGPDNGAKGRQLLCFDAGGGLLGAWSHPGRISSLQGILLV